MDTSMEIDYHGHLIDDDELSDLSYISGTITATSQSSDSEADKKIATSVIFIVCILVKW